MQGLQGINGTIFVYGQTGGGKTHTMFGKDMFRESEKRNHKRYKSSNDINSIYNLSFGDIHK